MLLLLSGLVTMQSCKKDEQPTPVVYKAAVPANPKPAAGGVVLLAGTSYTVTWEGNATSWDVYLGKTDPPALAKAGVNGKSYTFTTATGGKFFWYVKTKDANNLVSTSPTWSFYINSAPTVPAMVPANEAVGFSAKGALNFPSTDAEGDAITYDVFMGATEATLALVATGLTASTYSPTMAYTTKYYWKVVAKDSHGASTTSAVWSFTTGAFVPDFSVFNGVSSEVSPSFSATAKFDVYVKINVTTKVITLFLPLADGMVAAGWGNVYTGSHPIYVTYDPVTFAITGATQPWMDSFVDPKEMGPMTLAVKSGTIDAAAKKLTITWIMDGNAYWGGAATLKAATYTMK